MQTTQINGLDQGRIRALASQVQNVDKFGDFQFQVRNEWISGSRNRSFISGFTAGGADRIAERQVVQVSADQPQFLAGTDTAANPVEHYLHALVSCLTTTLVYHASAQDIEIRGIETTATGHLNARGFFGVDDAVAKGYSQVDVTMEVDSNADAAALKQLASLSPVLDMVSRAMPVQFNLNNGENHA